MTPTKVGWGGGGAKTIKLEDETRLRTTAITNNQSNDISDSRRAKEILSSNRNKISFGQKTQRQGRNIHPTGVNEFLSLFNISHHPIRQVKDTTTHRLDQNRSNRYANNAFDK